MNLRDFLKQRERELAHEIAQLRSRLSPLELELAQVRQAKEVIEGNNANPDQSTDQAIAAIERGFGKARAARGDEPSVPAFLIDPQMPPVQTDLRALGPSPYADLTMKQLIVKALEEHFRHGATAQELLDFFKEAWGRNIDRRNFSPQLTRLYREGIVGRIKSNHSWFLVPQVEIRGRMPYRRAINGEIVWMLPNQARHDDELLLTRDVQATHGEDREGRRPYRVIAADGYCRVGEIVWLRPEEAATQGLFEEVLPDLPDLDED